MLSSVTLVRNSIGLNVSVGVVGVVGLKSAWDLCTNKNKS
jgi:hypothetical protein